MKKKTSSCRVLWNLVTSWGNQNIAIELVYNGEPYLLEFNFEQEQSVELVMTAAWRNFLERHKIEVNTLYN